MFTAVNFWCIDIYNLQTVPLSDVQKLCLIVGNWPVELWLTVVLLCVLKLHSTRRDTDLIPDVLNSPDVPTGPHLLSVISHDYSFDFVCNVPTLPSISHSKLLPTAASRHRR